MTKDLLIVFVKNSRPGKVKTRLAKSIGNQAAFEVYNALVDLTRQAIKPIQADTFIFFSEFIENNTWGNCQKSIQKGDDLGQRMENAFSQGFDAGYERIVLIGSDLPDISAHLIQNAFTSLTQNDLTFGPALDGGYYLIGQSKHHPEVFQNMAWSTATLLAETLETLKKQGLTFNLLKPLNDIDTLADLEASTLYKTNKLLQTKIKQ